MVTPYALLLFTKQDYFTENVCNDLDDPSYFNEIINLRVLLQMCTLPRREPHTCTIDA
jgi:hypothetical protein